MRLFFRIVITTCLILLLILKTGEFFYLKFFNFESNFELLPSNTNYAISLNKDEILNLSDLKVKYHLTNFSRFHSNQEYKLEKNISQIIFADVLCENTKNTFVTIFEDLKPSQIQVYSNHKLIQNDNNLYLTDLNCELNFENSKSYNDLIANVSKSKFGFVLISESYIKENVNFLPINSDLVGAFNQYQDSLILNSFAYHSLEELGNLQKNLTKKDIKCLNPNQNFLAIKEPISFIYKTNFKNLNFINNFQNGIQINFDKTLEICNQEKLFNLKNKVDLKTISEKLPDNSTANYYDLDLSKLFVQEDISSKNAYYNESLLKVSDLFLQYIFPSFKTQTYFNFLSDSLNSITIFYE